LQLVVQDLGALVERADGAHPVARVGLQLHERPISDLLERLEADPASSVVDGLAEVADTAPASHQVVTQLDALLAQRLPLRKHPVVKHRRQQIPLILSDCSCSMLEHRVLVPVRHRLQSELPLTVKHTYVYAACRPLSPHQCGRLNDQRGVVTEEHAEMMQLASQVRPRLLLGGIGPESRGQTLPRLGCVGVECKEAEQGDGARRAWEVRRGRSCDVLFPEK
jgi:hypothetical protein